MTRSLCLVHGDFVRWAWFRVTSFVGSGECGVLGDPLENESARSLDSALDRFAPAASLGMTVLLPPHVNHESENLFFGAL